MAFFRAQCFECNAGSFDNLHDEFVVRFCQENSFAWRGFIVYKPRIGIVSGDPNECQVLEQLG